MYIAVLRGQLLNDDVSPAQAFIKVLRGQSFNNDVSKAQAFIKVLRGQSFNYDVSKAQAFIKVLRGQSFNIDLSPAQVYITVLGGQSFNFATVPLFWELCVEAVYPCPEAGVGTISMMLNNAVAMIFLFLFYIPGICEKHKLHEITKI